MVGSVPWTTSNRVSRLHNMKKKIHMLGTTSRDRHPLRWKPWIGSDATNGEIPKSIGNSCGVLWQEPRNPWPTNSYTHGTLFLKWTLEVISNGF